MYTYRGKKVQADAMWATSQAKFIQKKPVMKVNGRKCVAKKVARVVVCFFFQAEDGIRDLTVTGVQTCALPIYLAAMRDASARLVGRRDFSSFAAGSGGVRSVRRAEWCQPGTSQLRFEVEADAFLRGMVRAIVGTLLWVGRGKIDVPGLERIVAANDRAMAGPSAPANGLCLIALAYRQAAANAAHDERFH